MPECRRDQKGISTPMNWCSLWRSAGVAWGPLFCQNIDGLYWEANTHFDGLASWKFGEHLTSSIPFFTRLHGTQWPSKFVSLGDLVDSASILFGSCRPSSGRYCSWLWLRSPKLKTRVVCSQWCQRLSRPEKWATRWASAMGLGIFSQWLLQCTAFDDPCLHHIQTNGCLLD